MLLYQFKKHDKINILKLIGLACILLLFLPKINFISFEGQSAGLRIDDILLFIIAGVLLLIYLIRKKFFPTQLEWYLFAFIGMGLISNILNVVIHNNSNPLYTVRIFEYCLFFYAGHFSKIFFPLKNVLLIYLYTTLLLFLLQKLVIIGGFTSLGYVQDVSDRVIGLTGGPWEIGLILSFVLCILLYSEENNISKLAKIYYFVLIFFMVLATGARLPTLSVLLIGGHWLYKITKNKLIFISLLITFMLLSISFLVTFDNPVVERSTNLFSYSNINQFVEYYSQTNVENRFTEFPEVPVDVDSDMSWLFRVAKWSYAIKYWLNSSLSYVLGLGPGIWGLALDGGWVRLLTENGIIGICIFMLFLRKVTLINLPLKMIVFSFSVNMFMIDIYLAYKCMAFFLFCVGFYCSRGNEFFTKKGTAK